MCNCKYKTVLYSTIQQGRNQKAAITINNSVSNYVVHVVAVLAYGIIPHTNKTRIHTTELYYNKFISCGVRILSINPLKFINQGHPERSDEP